MWGKIAGVVLLAAVFQYYMKLRIWLDWDKQFTYRHAPGPCTQVLKDGGSEDMAHIGNGVVLISSGYRFVGTSRGKILMMNLNKGLVPIELNITNPPSAPNFMASPHGISIWKDEKTGEVTLYVITHPPDQDKVEVFELQTPPSLKHIRTITHRKFANMNDLVIVDKDKFYITQYMHSRDYNKAVFEIWLFSHIKYTGKVFYYDGEKAREVASDLFVPNGINISPDKSKCAEQKLHPLSYTDGDMDSQRQQDQHKSRYVPHIICDSGLGAKMSVLFACLIKRNLRPYVKSNKKLDIQKNPLNETVLLSTQNIRKKYGTIYVAEFGSDNVIGYQRKPNNDLVQIWSYDTDCSVDNIQVDFVTGDLWLGCQPLMKAVMDVYGWLGLPRASQVLKMKMKSNMVSEVIDVYGDPDGTEAFGCSVATYVDGKLLIGTVTHQMVVCDSKYIM